jgi:phosphoribosylaminoimidazole-succinocarboxamide synthase
VAKRWSSCAHAPWRCTSAGERSRPKGGIIIADTKFEFGRDADGEIRVMDEVLTPDSSRFWPESEYGTGRGQPSLDKQPVRDYLETLVESGQWDRQPPAPDLPDSIVQETSQRYQNVFRPSHRQHPR